MTHTNLYHQTFFELTAEQIEYTLYCSLESVLVSHNELCTPKDQKVIECYYNELEEPLAYWNELTTPLKKQIIIESIQHGYQYGYDSGLDITYHKENLEHSQAFWNINENITAEQIQQHIDWKQSLPQISK